MGKVWIESIERVSAGGIMIVDLFSKIKPVFPKADLRGQGSVWQIFLDRSLFDVVVLAETLKREGKPPHGILVLVPEILPYAKAVADAYATRSGHDVVIFTNYVDSRYECAVQPASA